MNLVQAAVRAISDNIVWNTTTIYNETESYPLAKNRDAGKKQRAAHPYRTGTNDHAGSTCQLKETSDGCICI